MKLNSNFRLFLAALGSSILAVSSAHAQSGTWDVNAGGDWSTTTNWAGGTVADGSGNTALFSMTTTGAARTINVDSARTIGNITRSGAFNNPLIISGSAITFAGTNPTITNNNAGNAPRIAIASQILGSDGLNIAGGGFVELTNNTTNYTGATTITDGSLLSFGGISLANIGGGSGRNISVGAGSSVQRAWQSFDNTFLNRIAQTNDEIGVFMSATAGSTNNNNLDFSSAGADLPNAFFGSWSSNGAIARYNGVITPASDNYRIGLIGSSGAFHIMQPLTDIAGDPRGLIIGGGTPILAADNTFTGDTVLREGRLFIGKQLALQNSALNVGNGSDGINGQFVFTNGPGGNAPPLDVVDAPTIGGLIGSRNLADIYNAANQNNTNRLAASAVVGITLNPGTGKTHTYDGNVALNSTMSLTITGNGTQILNGTNTYTGATTINGGTLALGAAGSIDNTSGVILGSGTFDVLAVAGGYTINNLSGIGTVAGSITVASELAIGTSPGTMNFDNLTLGASSTYTYELIGGGTDADLGNVSGTLTLTAGTILDLVQLGTYTVGDKFTLFAYETGNLTGTFDGLADGDEYTGAGGLWQIFYADSTAGLNGGTGTSFVTVTALIPEPSTALLGGLGVLMLLRRRR